MRMNLLLAISLVLAAIFIVILLVAITVNYYS